MADEQPTILVVDENEDSRVELGKLLLRAGLEPAGEARYGANAAAVADQVRPALILVGIEEPPNRALQTIETLSKLLLETPIIAYSSIEEVGAIRRATRAGVRDFLIRPFDSPSLREAIESALGQEQHRRILRAGGVPPPVRGSVITVSGAKGGVGKSSVAINLALALRQVTGRTVALVDADTHFGDTAMMLNLPTEPPVTHSIAMIDKLDRGSVLQQSIEHRSGLRVFPAPPEPEEWEGIAPESVERFINLLSESFDFVVIDTPDMFDRIVERCVHSSTLVLLVTSMDISSISDTKIALRTLHRWDCPAEKVRITVNHIRSRDGLRERHVAEALKWPVFWTVPFDKYVAEAAQMGESLLEKSPKTNFSRSVRELAGAISGAGTGEIRRNGSGGGRRLFGLLPRRAGQDSMNASRAPRALGDGAGSGVAGRGSSSMADALANANAGVRR